MTLVAAWLRRVARSPHAGALVVRGSLVTRHYFPARVAEDVDHLAVGATDLDAARAIIAEVVATPDDVPLALDAQETIWADSAFPGLRTQLRSDDTVLQVDVGFGDPLTLPARRLAIEGIEISAVSAESMVAWKLHGLVELGARGRWRPKDLYDLALYAKLELDRESLPAAIAMAFTSRGHDVALLDSFIDDATWGGSRGSRNRWKTLRRTIPTAPELGDAIELVRSRFGPLVRAARPR